MESESKSYIMFNIFAWCLIDKKSDYSSLQKVGVFVTVWHTLAQRS